MLINYSVCGDIDINGDPVVVNYVVQNITTGFVSKVFQSELGYYNINLSNFPNGVFDTDNIIVITFSIRYNGIDYKSIMYHVVNPTQDAMVMNTTLVSNWNYTSAIKIEDINTTKRITFLTSEYQQILFKLYIKYKNIYKEIDSAFINNQILNINFSHNGEFKIIGYVVKDNKLLTYSEKSFTVNLTQNTNINNPQVRYIEWE